MKNKKTCIGIGLVSLDMLMRGDDETRVSCRVGGTCGNVMMILSHLGWDTYPIARLDGSQYSATMLRNMEQFGVHTDFVSTGNDGKTPIIVQHNIIDKDGHPTHKFTFRDGRGGFYLAYSAVTIRQAQAIAEELSFVPDVFFFDRVSPATALLARTLRERGSLVVFEPSVKKLDAKFFQCVEQSHIVKFAAQRIPDADFADRFPDKLFIQTLGAEGLRYNLRGAGWKSLPPVVNPNVVDTSGAGDWTTSAFLDALPSLSFAALDDAAIRASLTAAQQTGSLSCSHEGARGMMEPYD